MAVVCPKCGQRYEDSIFTFGRTINCACGERVGPTEPAGVPEGAELRFFADVMMHRLVRLLRALGYDTAWEDAIPDAELVRRSLTEHRHILTQDRRLAKEWRIANILLLRSEKPLDQLREVIEHFDIHRSGRLFTRCLVCNTPLDDAAPDAVLSQAPESHGRTHNEYRWCPACRKLYWAGSHTNRMSGAIEKVFADMGR